MITRTFQKTTFTVKGINKNDSIESFEISLWEFDIPTGKKALSSFFENACNERELEYFKHSITNKESEIRGVDERTFYNNSVHVER